MSDDVKREVEAAWKAANRVNSHDPDMMEDNCRCEWCASAASAILEAKAGGIESCCPFVQDGGPACGRCISYCKRAVALRKAAKELE